MSAEVALLSLEEISRDLEVAYEREIQYTPYSVKVWVTYLRAKKDAPLSWRSLTYERALKLLPRSYKLWHSYLQERMAAVESEHPSSPAFASVNSAFERMLTHLSKMPVMWGMYTKFLWKQQRLITSTRRAYNRALQALPLTQHHSLWDEFLLFAKECDCAETATTVFARYLMLYPAHAEIYISYLISIGRYDEAATRLAAIVTDEDFISIDGKSKHRLWMDLCHLITTHPKEVSNLEVEPILRSGIKKFSDEVGHLWGALADHFIRLGQLEKARDVYEEALRGVSTVRDFSLVFDAYTKFEENFIAAKMNESKTRAKHPDSLTLSASRFDEYSVEEVDLLLARLESLVERRAELLSSVKLRQNPNNVHEWLSRIRLFVDDPAKVVRTFSEALMTIDPRVSVGKISVLWMKFAYYYISQDDDLVNARKVFERATKAMFKSPDDLASIWCAWVEMELRRSNWIAALETARRAVSPPPSGARDAASFAQSRVHRSVKLWSLCADLEESFGTTDTARACYDKMFELKVVTPRLALNYAEILQERQFFEESFRVYERSVEAFRWPHLYDIWMTYLSRFVARFKGRKLERARELFEQAMTEVPPQFAKRVGLLYAKLEEQFGLARHALRIYERVAQLVPKEQAYDMYVLYIAKTAAFFGIAKVRQIFEVAVERLPDDRVKDMCILAAGIERGLGETDRARTLFVHASQFCDPSKERQFWLEWRDFEVAHGNEDTFRDMLRTRRSVQAQYVQVHFNSTEALLGDAAAAAEQAPLDPMAAAEAALKEDEREEAGGNIIGGPDDM